MDFKRVCQEVRDFNITLPYKTLKLISSLQRDKEGAVKANDSAQKRATPPIPATPPTTAAVPPPQEPQARDVYEIPGNVMTYKILISDCFAKNQSDIAMRYFRAMPSVKIAPDLKLYNIMLLNLCKVKKIDDAVTIFEEMPSKGVEPDNLSRNALLHALLKANRNSEAQELLRTWPGRNRGDIPSSSIPAEVAGWRQKVAEVSQNVLPPAIPLEPNVNLDNLSKELLASIKGSPSNNGVAANPPSGIPARTDYNVRIEGHISNRLFQGAIALLDEMISNKLVPDSSIYTSLLNALCKDNRVNELIYVVSKMDHSIKLDCMIYNGVIIILLKKRLVDEALNCFDRMVQARVDVNRDLYKTIIFGLHKVEGVHKAKPVFDQMEKTRFVATTKMFNVFISGLIKAGETENAIVAFRLMSQMEVMADHETPGFDRGA